MRRKLVQMGKNCLMAAIPKKWLDQQGLEKGDFLEIERADNYLLMSAKPLPKEKSLSFKIDKASRVGVIRTLQLLYDAGYKRMEITYKDQKSLDYIMFTISLLEQWKLRVVSDNKCIIETVETIDIDFQKYFRVTFLMLKELIDEYSRVLINNSKEMVESIRMKYRLILIRTMNLKRMINTSSMPLEYKYYYFIAVQFEEIADHYEYLLRKLENERAEPELLRMQKKLQEMVEEVYQNFYKFNIEKFMAFTSESIWKQFETKKTPPQTYHLRAISERIKNIAKYTLGIRLR